MKINYYIKYWLPVLIWMAFIYYLSSLSNPLEQLTPKNFFFLFDFKHFIYHVIEYLILSLLLYRALKINSKNPQTLAILVTVLYAIMDEIHQSFVPGRISSVFDVAIDSFGAIAAQCIVNIYHWLKRK